MFQAWIKALAFMSNLEELVIDGAQPGVKALQALVVRSVHASHLGTAATHGRQYTPLYLSIKRFGLRYRGWLRPSEHFDLSCMSIILQSKFSTKPLHMERERPKGTI